MIYRVDQVKLDIAADPDRLWNQAVRKAEILSHMKRGSLRCKGMTVLHRSLDARKKDRIVWVYQVALETDTDLPLPLWEPEEYIQLQATRVPDDPPVIVGSGPCGLFCALILARGGLSPILIERGRPVDERVRDVERFWKEGVLDEESNVQFGEGGAGTFSDGKLTTGIRDKRIRKVLEEFVRAGAPADILIRQKPHLGTDALRGLIPEIRKEIEALGGTVLFETRLDDLKIEEGKIKGAVMADGRTLPTEEVVLAMGHSARDTFAMLNERGVPMTQKPFSIGLRIEHPQDVIDRAQYGDNYEEVRALAGAADYKLHRFAEDGRGVYTFCMCPGGSIVDSSSEPGTAVTNGMSDAARDSGFANSALLVDVTTDDLPGCDVLAGVRFQKTYEELAFEQGRGKLPETVYGDFEGSAPYRSLPDFAAADLMESIPVFGTKIAGFDDPNARLVGVESRSSSPVRVLRGEDLQSEVRGLYPAGEGCGYAGGITSAAVDGIRIAEAILSKYL